MEDVREGDFRKSTTADENMTFHTGNLTADPKAKVSQSGTVINQMTLACHRMVNGTRETTFIPIIAYGRLAETFEKIGHKGCWVYVRGRLDTWNGVKKVDIGEDEFIEVEVPRSVITVQFARLHPKNRDVVEVTE